MASESPERLEELRKRFLRALSDQGGGAEEGRPAMGSEVAEGTGLHPEENPDDRALSERLAAELVDVGYASAEAGSSGFLVITPEGEQALRGGASRNEGPRPSPRNAIDWLFCATGLSQRVLHFSAPHYWKPWISSSVQLKGWRRPVEVAATAAAMVSQWHFGE